MKEHPGAESDLSPVNNKPVPGAATWYLARQSKPDWSREHSTLTRPQMGEEAREGRGQDSGHERGYGSGRIPEDKMGLNQNS